MIPVLVTGGAGYIGSHTAKALACAGFEPIVLDNFSTGHRWAVKWGRLVAGDLADGDLIRQTLGSYNVQAVIHFAASAYVGESVCNPRKYFRNNLVNTLNLLDALVDMKVPHLVVSSTCATYGIPESIPIAEDHPQRPVNPYGESKLAIERALQWYGKAHGFGWTVLRYFNAAGADPDGEIGEVHDPEPHLIPLAIQAALGERPYVEICGTDYETPDGTAIRDYVHVSDLAAAHVLALRHLLTHRQNKALNLGTGKGHSVREVVRAVERAVGAPIRIREVGRRPGDPPVLTADPSEASRILGWHPSLSEIDTIVQTAARWQVRQSHKTARKVVEAVHLSEMHALPAA